MVNYYHILGIHENASDAEIKAAFKQKALQHHPDKNPGDRQSEEIFKEINEAHQTLSNSYERARYDLKLKFGEQSVEYPTSPPPQYRPQPRPYRRPRYTGRPIDHKTNDKATAWAFGISLAVATLVMAGIQVFDMYQAYQKDILLGERRKVYNQARNYYTTGNVMMSLTMLDQLGTYHEEEKDIRNFEEDVLANLLQSGTGKFYRGQYENALEDLTIFESYTPNTRLSFQLLIAECFMKAGNYAEAISRYNKIIILGNETIDNYLKLAWIYREGLNDYERALAYYELASKMAINEYKAVFGLAYVLVLNPHNVPPNHFEVFHGLAQTLYHVGNYERALKAIKWNVAMWPDFPDHHILKGQIFEQQGKHRAACLEFNVAIDKGWEEEVRCTG
ncbi:MAG: DnaJ domain-containing protein [Cyclobacteriaceae bacterium]